ncbi:hypothetical protein JCM14469_42170 [Desulfatiferula olefinivorans]
MTKDRHTIEHYEGCLLGGAVGDALGAPVEFMSLSEIKGQFGPSGIKDYYPAFGKTGAITDDTQMTLFTAEAMLRAVTRGHHKGIASPTSMARLAYQRWLVTQESEFSGYTDDRLLLGIPELYSRRAPGQSCLSALKSSREGSIEKPINNSKGCGGVMRIAPVALAPNFPDFFDNGCEIAAITHGHPTGYLAAGCLAQIIRNIVDGQDLIDAVQSVQTILATKRHSDECLAAIENALDAFRTQPATFETVEALGEGWIAEEALAMGIYCALAADDDFEKGLILSVNHGGDSDSTGSITGNILGALLGVSAIPKRYLDSLELKDTIKEMAEDLFTGVRDTDAWWDKYPGY